MSDEFGFSIPMSWQEYWQQLLDDTMELDQQLDKKHGIPKKDFSD